MAAPPGRSVTLDSSSRQLSSFSGHIGSLIQRGNVSLHMFLGRGGCSYQMEQIKATIKAEKSQFVTIIATNGGQFRPRLQLLAAKIASSGDDERGTEVCCHSFFIGSQHERPEKPGDRRKWEFDSCFSAFYARLCVRPTTDAGLHSVCASNQLNLSSQLHIEIV